MSEQIERHYKIPEAAGLLGIKESTLRQWIFYELISNVKVRGRVLISEKEIRRLLREGTRPALTVK